MACEDENLANLDLDGLRGEIDEIDQLLSDARRLAGLPLDAEAN